LHGAVWLRQSPAVTRLGERPSHLTADTSLADGCAQKAAPAPRRRAARRRLSQLSWDSKAQEFWPAPGEPSRRFAKGSLSIRFAARERKLLWKPWKLWTTRQLLYGCGSALLSSSTLDAPLSYSSV